jgi:hypothetical protein
MEMSATNVVALRGTSPHASRRFFCRATVWQFLRDLGQTFGWQPKGTTYVASSKQSARPGTSLRHNYQPGGVEDCKQIEDADAMEWASALGIAKHSSYLGGMISAHAGLTDDGEKPVLEIMEDFIMFARRGAFVFAIDSEATTDAQRDA